MTQTASNRQADTVLHEKFSAVRQYSTAICAPLKIEDYVVQPAEYVSPPKWHLAHTTWFWEEFILSKYFTKYQRFHAAFSFLFNSYYESVGQRVPRSYRGNMTRPTVDEIVAYRKYVDEHMVQLMRNASEEVSDLITIGLNHEQQHQELLFTDIKYILGHNPLFPHYNSEFSENKKIHSDDTFVEMTGGLFKIGFEGEGFSFDNELGVHKVALEDFAIRKSLVSNDEYLEFINDNGYQRPDLWLSDGWTWSKEHNINGPLYWHIIDGKLQRYSLAGMKELNLSEPVTHVSFYEANAFAAWKGMRLPTEFEWEAASDTFYWGERWEHTNSAYLPYPRYKKPEGAVGEYNGKFMVNQMVLRGASIVTPEGHSRKTYRNFFEPSSRWQFNGVRLCK
ncbi:MAG: ergothioneine biosynthesis protein EgtB [Cyclobacteriaceae bacterium]